MASSNVLLDKQMKNMLNESIEFGKVKYASYLEEANKAYQETHGTTMPLHLQTTLVKNLRATEEFCEGKEYFREETTPGGINAFIHHAFDMVTAILPNTVIESSVLFRVWIRELVKCSIWTSSKVLQKVLTT